MGVADAGFQADSRSGVAMPCMGVMSPRAGVIMPRAGVMEPMRWLSYGDWPMGGASPGRSGGAKPAAAICAGLSARSDFFTVTVFMMASSSIRTVVSVASVTCSGYPRWNSPHTVSELLRWHTHTRHTPHAARHTQCDSVTELSPQAVTRAAL